MDVDGIGAIDGQVLDQAVVNFLHALGIRIVVRDVGRTSLVPRLSHNGDGRELRVATLGLVVVHSYVGRPLVCTIHAEVLPALAVLQVHVGAFVHGP